MATATYRDYSLTLKQSELRAAIARFSDASIKPSAREIDGGNYPSQILRELAIAGFTQAGFPSEVGGTDMDSVSWALIIAEVARGSGSAGLALGVTGTASLPLLRLANARQRKALLPVVNGETPGVYAQSEPGQGSDVAGITTTARQVERDGIPGWELSGHKLWISNAWLGPDRRAHWAVVLCQTGEVGNRRTMRFFLVPLDLPGIEVQKINTTGMRGSGTSQIFFDRAFVPEEALLGNDDAGFQAAMQVLGASRIFFSARGLGIVEAAVDMVGHLLSEAQTASDNDPRIPLAISRLHFLEAKAFNLRALVYRVARLRDAGQPFDHQVAILKLIAGNTAIDVTSEAYNLMLFLGASAEDLKDADRIARDSKQIPLAEGTSEIMERIIARDLAASLRSDGGPSLRSMLVNPQGMNDMFTKAEHVADFLDLLLDLAKAAYRDASETGEERLLNFDLMTESGDQQRYSKLLPLSPIPSPRQEPLGAERALAGLEITCYEVRTLSEALIGTVEMDFDYPAHVATKNLIDSKATSAVAQTHAVFEALGQNNYWTQVGSMIFSRASLFGRQQ